MFNIRYDCFGKFGITYNSSVFYIQDIQAIDLFISNDIIYTLL